CCSVRLLSAPIPASIAPLYAGQYGGEYKAITPAISKKAFIWSARNGEPLSHFNTSGAPNRANSSASTMPTISSVPPSTRPRATPARSRGARRAAARGRDDPPAGGHPPTAPPPAGFRPTPPPPPPRRPCRAPPGVFGGRPPPPPRR